jgi:hypothetical protein
MINFFWATFFIFYDPIEFLTGACQTPTGQEMSIFHLCALVEITAFRLGRIFQPMRALEFLTGHVVYNPTYN